MKMECPHCHDKSAAFEAEEDLTFRPTIEDWEFAPTVRDRVGKFTCLKCDSLVELDFKQRFIKKVHRPEPVYDDAVKKILEMAKANADKLVPGPMVDLLREKNYRNLSLMMTGSELRVAVIEQKP